MKLSWLMVVVFALAAGACGSDSNSGGDAAAGSSGGGTTGSAGTTGRGGTTGGGGAGRSGAHAGSAGTTGNAGATGGGGTTGTQPLGAACVNTGMCSQADGPAVCCLQLSTCIGVSRCAASPGPTYPCSSANPCSKGGWVCCNAGGMNFCTKQSGCPGAVDAGPHAASGPLAPRSGERVRGRGLRPRACAISGGVWGQDIGYREGTGHRLQVFGQFASLVLGSRARGIKRLGP